jgi:hypothetical protein
VFIIANFYGYLAGKLSGVDVTSAAFRAAVSPLNTPANAQLIGVVREASAASFHIAMLVAALLLIVGALVNGIGIQDAVAKKQVEASSEPASGTSEVAGRAARESG